MPVEADPPQNGPQIRCTAFFLRHITVVADFEVHGEAGGLIGRVVVPQLGPVVLKDAFVVEGECPLLCWKPVVRTWLVEVVQGLGSKLGHRGSPRLSLARGLRFFGRNPGGVAGDLRSLCGR